jgi:hypothetical protein
MTGQTEPNLAYAHLKGQQAVLACTKDEQIYFTLVVYGNGRFIQTIRVIVGAKLKQLSSVIKRADHPPSPP